MLALGRRSVIAFYWGLCVTFGLNVFFFDGLGEGFKGFLGGLRMLPGFDLTILVALANVAIFIQLLRTRRWGYEAAATTGS